MSEGDDFSKALKKAKSKYSKGKFTQSEVANWVHYSGGQFWAGWGYFGPPAVSFLLDVCGLDVEREIELKARAQAAVVSSAGWWWGTEKFVTVSERPLHIKKDEQGRLHCSDGPAIRYRDGWCLYSWRGVDVPESWIMRKQELTAKEVFGQTNMELRRAGAEIVGWERLLASVGSRELDVDPDPQIGKLLEADLPDAPKQRFLLVKCGTGRQFCIPVPNSVNTALQANAWTYGIDSAVSLDRFRGYKVRT